MADINVHAAAWNALTIGDQTKIQNILKSTTLLNTGDRVIPDSTVQPMEVPQALLDNPFCTIACSVAETAAVAACGALSGPAFAICVAAAHQAADYCRSRC